MNLFSSAEKKRRHANRFRPQLEVLEDRRLMSAGSLDTTFSGDGMVTTANLGKAVAMEIQADGKIVTLSGPNASVARYNTNGTLDKTFDKDGIASVNLGSNPGLGDLAIQADGKIIAVGRTGGSNDWAIVHFNTNGSLDKSFGNNGKVILDFYQGFDNPYSVVIQSDGKIVVAGTARDSASNQKYGLARLLSNCALDTTFGTNGRMLVTPPGSALSPQDLVIDSDGRMLFLTSHYLWRFTSTGAPDTSFGSGTGRVTVYHNSGLFPDVIAKSLTLDSTGKILVAGEAFVPDDSSDYSLVRLNSDGSYDTSFDGDGGLTFTFGTPYHHEGAKSIIIQPDGKYLLAGEIHEPWNMGLARLNPDGSLDTSFGTGGKIITAAFGSASTKYQVRLGPDGKIVVAGASDSGALMLARYLNDITSSVSMQQAQDAFFAMLAGEEEETN